jgi:molybdopterin synthase sulfur carrier subunit
VVRVEFLGPIKREAMSLEVGSLRELSEVLSQDEELKEWLKLSAVALNDTIVEDIDVKLKDGDRVSLLPPVCGG